MAECGAESNFCRDDLTWTFHCAADEDHEPGQHDYQLDEGQSPLPEGV